MVKQPEDFNRLRAKIIVKAWKDPRFKQQLLKNPRAALKEMGLEIPKNIEVKIVEDKQNTFTFVLPEFNANMRELRDTDLEKMAGGTRLGITGINTFCKVGEGCL